MINKYNRIIVASIMMSISIFPITNTSAATTFTDTRTYIYRESITFLANRGVVKWYPDWTFWPNKDITRAELMKIILEWAKANIWSWNNCFSDVKDQWYAPYICYAKVNKLAKWYPDWTFKPEQKVTIAEWFKITLGWFNAWILEWKWNARAQPYIDYIHNNNIFSKFGIIPWYNLTRGNMSYLVHQLILKKEWTITFDNIRKPWTLWCGKSPPWTAPNTSLIGGINRHYITVVWKNYNQNMPMKLIFAFHGRTNPNTMIRTYYKVEQASQGNAIIVYPSWLPEEWPTRSRQSPGDKSYALRDFQLFDQLVQEFSNNYCINKDQIFVVWHSLGAWFTNTLACARGDVIRAIWSVWWSITKNTCTWPTASLIMHNPLDNLASFAGWVAARDVFLRQNSCWPETIPVWPDWWNCVQYTNCQTDAPVIRCPHTDSIDERWVYYPHTRPDFAGKYIRDFFDAQK